MNKGMINGLIHAGILKSLLMAFLPLLISCEKEVTLDLSNLEGQYLIVEGNIDDASPKQWIRLSFSSSYYDTGKGRPATNASVSVTDGINGFVFTESNIDTLAGYYFNNEIGRKLKQGNYRLNIEHDGDVYTAESEFRPVPEIDSVTVGLNYFSSTGLTDEILYDIYTHFRDLPSEGNHYLVDLDINGRLETARPTQKTVISDENLEGYVSLSVKTINGNILEDDDVLTVKMRSISREKYDFYQIFLFQTDLSGNPFAGAPPANIPTNMSEGALGFFQVSAVSESGKVFRPLTR